jgi:hypothetical protein
MMLYTTMEETMSITIDRSYNNYGPAPIYPRGLRPTDPHRAVLRLDELGTVDVAPDYNTDGSTTLDVWLGQTIQYSIPACLSAAGIDNLLDNIMPLLERIHSGHTVMWNGNNHIGVMTSDARAAHDELVRHLEQAQYDTDNNVIDAIEYCRDAWSIVVDEYRDAESREEYIDDLVDVASQDDYVLVNIDRLVSELDREIGSM